MLTDDGNIGDNVGVCALKCPKDCFIERDALLADSQMGFSIGLLFYS